LNKRLGSLFLVSVIDILGFGILIPLLPYMGERFGASPEVITPVLGAYSLCQLLSAPFWGALSDRHGRRPILMTSLAGACVSYAMLALADNIWWLLASRILGGFMAGNIAAAFAYASDISTPQNRAASLGMVGAAIGVGFTLGPALGGVLAGNDLHTANFALPAIVSACLSVLAIAVVAFILPETRTAAERAHGAARSSTPLRLLRERASLRFIATAALLVTSSQAILESIFAIWALARFGFGPRTAGLFMFCLAIFAVLTQGGLVRVLAPKLGEQKLATLGVGAYVVGLVVVAEAPNITVAAIALALCGIGVGAFNPSASALASRQSDDHDRGAVMGTYQSSTSLARVLGPFVSGPVFQWLGPAAPFVIGACVALPAAWFVWRVKTSRP
jgi:MFS transporter, DHA1 family, tetracycline resistance protein